MSAIFDLQPPLAADAVPLTPKELELADACKTIRSALMGRDSREKQHIAEAGVLGIAQALRASE